MNQILEVQNDAILNVQNEKENFEAKIDEINPYFENLESTICDLKDGLEVRDRQIANLTDETVLRGKWALELNAELNEVRKRLDGLTSSNSWRVTLPLRELSRWLKSPLQQLRRYSSLINVNSKKLYHHLPLNDRTKLRHYQFLVRFMPQLLAGPKPRTINEQFDAPHPNSVEQNPANGVFQAVQ